MGYCLGFWGNRCEWKGWVVLSVHRSAPGGGVAFDYSWLGAAGTNTFCHTSKDLNREYEV